MPTWLGVVLASSTLIVTIWSAAGNSDQVVRGVVGTARADVLRAALRAACFQSGWLVLVLLLLGYLLGFPAAHVSGRTWTSAVVVLPVTVWWGARAIVLTPAEHGPSGPDIMTASGATRGVARAVLAVSFPFALLGMSAATAAVLASTELFL